MTAKSVRIYIPHLFFSDEEAHQKVKSLKTAVDNYKENLFTCNGYSINNDKFDNPGYFISYLVEKKRPTDASVCQYFKEALKSAADVNLAELAKYAYPVGNNPSADSPWGHNVMQPLYACAPILYWRFSGEKKYMDAACNLLNYSLGLNPLGICYVTGPGFHQIHNPHDRESAYTASKGWGPKPGITIFGPGIVSSYGRADLATYPEIGSLPPQRKFGDDMASICTAEFTIFETMSHYALYTVLSNGGTWDEANDPFSAQQVAVKKTSGVVISNYESNKPKICVSAGRLNVSFASNQKRHISGGLYSPNGKKLLGFTAEIRGGGENGISVPLDKASLDKIARTVTICRLTDNTGKSFVARIIYKD